jgi:putative intracellular protease/amidase
MRVNVGRAALAATTAALLFAAPASASVRREAPNHKIGHSTSTNWAGYAVAGGRYTSVSAAWTQPSVNCSVTASGWSSFWVGLDGDTSNTVEQTGTEADCSNGHPVYSTWYEMYPKYPKNYANPVAAGDRFTASVTTDGRGSFTLTLSDTTRNWSQTTVARLRSASLSSAEVIAEAPSSSGGVLPLADFGSVAFGSATVNGSLLTSSTPGLDPLTMASGSTVKAQPSSISNGSFSVTWRHA